MFELTHYSDLKAVEKLNDEIFATSSIDGIINIWNTRMNKLLTSISVNDSGVSALKFIQKRGLLICGHQSGLTCYSVTDNFQSKKIVEVPRETG